MPESRLFMSSLSRRQLARRRPGRSLSAMLAGVLLVVAVCVAAFLLARGGI